MAPTTDSLKPDSNRRGTNDVKKRGGVCCFSFAAYAKTLIQYLRTTCNVPIQEGLSDSEFSALETSLRFTFPPDLRSILREGLPSSAGFPDWRSASPRPHLLLSHSDLVSSSYTKSFAGAPVLVPIYRHFYIPSSPDSGNPVFSVRGGQVFLSAFDLAGFFHRFRCLDGVEFQHDDGVVAERASSSGMMEVPAWAATEPRRVEVWTDLAEETERRRRVESTLGRWWWWWGGGGDGCWRLRGCLEEVFWRLREGGWGVDEVREMMMMVDAKHDHREDEQVDEDDVAAYGGGGYEEAEEGAVVWQVRRLSLTMLRGGWSAEDVAYSLGGWKEGFLPRARKSQKTRQLLFLDE